MCCLPVICPSITISGCEVPGFWGPEKLLTYSTNDNSLAAPCEQVGYLVEKLTC